MHVVIDLTTVVVTTPHLLYRRKQSNRLGGIFVSICIATCWDKGKLIGIYDICSRNLPLCVCACVACFAAFLIVL